MANNTPTTVATKGAFKGLREDCKDPARARRGGGPCVGPRKGSGGNRAVPPSVAR